MRVKIILLTTILFVSNLYLNAQNRAMGYELIFGKNTFQTTSKKYKEPANSSFFSDEFYFLFKDKNVVIKIPERFDSIWACSFSQPKKCHLIIHKIDKFNVSKIIDTINEDEFVEMISTETIVSQKSKKFKVDRISFQILESNGRHIYSSNCDTSKLNLDNYLIMSFKELVNGGFLILESVAFIDDDSLKQEIKCSIAWVIEKKTTANSGFVQVGQTE